MLFRFFPPIKKGLQAHGEGFAICPLPLHSLLSAMASGISAEAFLSEHPSLRQMDIAHTVSASRLNAPDDPGYS
jgi:hypothetical protein